MADVYQILLRNGLAADVDTFTGGAGELTYDTDTGQVRVHDGSTVGGFNLAQAGGAGTFGALIADSLNKAAIGTTNANTGTFTVLTADSLDGAAIGSSNANTGNFTSLTATSLSVPSINGPSIGNSLANTGAFTVLTADSITKTGTLNISATVFTISNGGSESVRIDSSGNLLVNTTTDHNGKVSIKSTGTEQHLVFEQENVTTDGWGIRSYGAGGGNLEISRMTGNTTFTTLMSLLTNGNVNIVNDLYIGSSSGRTVGTDIWIPSLQVNDTQGIAAIRASNDAFGGALNLSSARGSYGSPTIVLNGDRLGGVYFSGYDGGNYQSYGAAIEAYVDGTPGVDDMPGSLRFYTVADGSNTLSERMRISANGNIGIGGTPAEKFDVIAPDNSSIIMARVTRSSKDYGIALENNGGTGESTINAFGSGAALIFETNSTERMRIDSSGHVGIGTTAPESFGGSHKTLEVSGSSNAHGGVFKTATSDSAGAGSAGTEMLMYTTSSGGTIAVTSADPLLFQTSSTERARITSGGTLAVGTTAGLNSELIHARRSSGTISTLYNSGATGDVLRLYHENTAVTAFSIWGGGAQRGFITSPVSSNGLILGYSGTEAARIDFNGNIGIGVTPGCRLHVYAADTSTMTLLRGDTHGTRFGFSASESLIDSVTAAVSDYAPLQINAKTSLTLRLNSATVVALATSGMTVTGTAVATQGMPIITDLTTARTLALSDIGAYIKTGNAAATTITVPPNSTVSWPQGAEIVIIQSNTGTVTIAPGAGVTLNSLDSLTDLAGRNAVVTLKRVGTDSWDLFGALA